MQTIRVSDPVFLHLLHIPRLNTIRDTPKGRRAIIGEAGILEIGRRKRSLQNGREGAELAPPVISVAALSVAHSQGNRTLIKREMHLRGRIPGFIIVCHCLIVGGWARRLDRLRSGDNFHDHLLVRRWTAGGEGLI